MVETEMATCSTILRLGGTAPASATWSTCTSSRPPSRAATFSPRRARRHAAKGKGEGGAGRPTISRPRCCAGSAEGRCRGSTKAGRLSPRPPPRRTGGRRALFPPPGSTGKKEGSGGGGGRGQAASWCPDGAKGPPSSAHGWRRCALPAARGGAAGPAALGEVRGCAGGTAVGFLLEWEVIDPHLRPAVVLQVVVVLGLASMMKLGAKQTATLKSRKKGIQQ
mmetsp:Transcript_24626/g.42971  ORF Transcript_24626/g.42971 Transcript_24626/m.42971 type:complete len:222 (+) Transcript_24626:1282-1947(+)